MRYRCPRSSRLDDRRQVVEQRIERLRVAGKEAADQLDRRRPALADAAEERQRAGVAASSSACVTGWARMPGALDMTCGSPLVKTMTSPCLEPHRLLAEHGGVAAAFGDHVIGDQVTGARQHLGQHHFTRRLLGNPRGEAMTSKNAAPVSRTAFRTSDRASVGISGPRPANSCCSWAVADAASSSRSSLDRGRERLSPPLPPNRTCRSPASGSPVGGLTHEGTDGPAHDKGQA